jgi:signal transduction histidine kinase
MKGSKGSEDELLLGDLSFAVAAAHELKSPLALIRQLSLALEENTLSDSEKQRLLRQITLVTERALRLTTDLSRSARLEDSLFELAPLNPQQICEEVAHELTPLYAAKGRTIRAASRYRPILALANQDLLRRIMLNFADNALHYADGDKPVELTVVTLEKGKKIRLGVRDYGPQVPATIWQAIETSLGTGKQALHGRPQSSGLGLYVAGQFAQAMQGTVGATRHRNGVSFYVDIGASAQLRLL